MSNFLWVKTEKRRDLLEALESIPEFGRKSKSELLEIALEDFVKKHSISNNPQTQIGIYTKDVLAVPNIYEALDNPDMWNKFYKNIKTQKEYKKVDKALNTILDLHNKNLK